MRPVTLQFVNNTLTLYLGHPYILTCKYRVECVKYGYTDMTDRRTERWVDKKSVDEDCDVLLIDRQTD